MRHKGVDSGCMKMDRLGPKGTVAQEEETPRSGAKGFREKRTGLWEEERDVGEVGLEG